MHVNHVIEECKHSDFFLTFSLTGPSEVAEDEMFISVFQTQIYPESNNGDGILSKQGTNYSNVVLRTQFKKISY